MGNRLSPFWSVLDFWKVKLGKSSSTNWIFSLQKSISKLILVSYTGPVRNRLKIQFVELDFSKLIIQKSSTYRSTGGLFHGSRAAVPCIFCKKLYPYKSWFLLSADFFNELHFSESPERFIPYFMENFKTLKAKTAYFLFKHWFRFLFLKEIDRKRNLNLAWWPHPSLFATLSHFASRKH